MNKVIFVSNHKGFIKFNAPYMELLKMKGCIVDDAGPGFEETYSKAYNRHYDVEIVRNPFSTANFKAIKSLRKILKEQEYDLIHCHTPMGAFVARIAAIGIKGLNVLYTIHGYHFFKGAPLKNWLIFFPIEFALRGKTDYAVTINNEDFEFAKKWKMAKKGVFKINGVGFRNKFSAVDQERRVRLRNEFGIKPDDFVMLYTAQFIVRKNHLFIIRTLPKLAKEIPNVKLILVGNGELFDKMKELSFELGMSNYIMFMGGRSDVEKFCQLADIYVAASFQEGLCVSNLEAMACGLPLVLTDIRGQNDVCEEGRNGYLYKIDDTTKFVNSVMALYKDDGLRKQIGLNNIEDVKKFAIDKSLSDMEKIYINILTSL